MHRTLVFDRSDRARFQVSGAGAAATINGLVTNDVAALRDGGGVYAAALTAKGKLVADMIVLAQRDSLLLDASAGAAPALGAMLSKFVNPRFAIQRDVTMDTCEIAVVGVGAADAVTHACKVQPETLAALTPYHHIAGSLGGVECTVVRLPAVGAESLAAYAIITQRSMRDAAISALAALGTTLGEPSEWNVLRVESGCPEWGVDMDDTTLPQEANFDELHGVSYTKGCYIGQETVARVHFRGHVNRTLRRLAFEGDLEPPRGAALTDADHRSVGEVRSSARSPLLGTIGIGMVRREVEDGAMLDVRWDGGAVQARVTGKAKGAID